tara:strand:- start:256 stop:900 length:645 start_codon:yes stop_codon:yes gene_type:complete
MKLKVSEIFCSIQGEGLDVGSPNIFLRLFGCNLRCSWCDSMYAVEGNDYENLSLDIILAKIRDLKYKKICITGGEPLLQQKTLVVLVENLLKDGYKIILETAGHIKPEGIFEDPNVLISMDCKCPESNMVDKSNISILKTLSNKDQIKFVIKDKSDYTFAKKIVLKEKFNAEVIFQPVYGSDSKLLVKHILEDKLNVRFVPQVHKFIWGDIKGV